MQVNIDLDLSWDVENFNAALESGVTKLYIF
jgi:hypothetical protein